MDRKQFKKYKTDEFFKTLVQEEQFGQWLRKFFYLNQELNKEYDTIYQNYFYVVFYELVTEGYKYVKELIKLLSSTNNKIKIQFYKELQVKLLKIKSEFTENELQFIEYKRHNSSHIFQNHYENRLVNYEKLKTNRKGKEIDTIKKELASVLIKHGNDGKFDLYMNSKLYPHIIELHKNLKIIQANENK